MDNKTRTRHFAVMLAVFVYASLTIGTVATALNSFPGTFLSIVALVLLACNLAICFCVGRKVVKEDK